MKAFTDIEQSQKLAEILPLESADMCYDNDGTAIKVQLVPYEEAKERWWDYGKVTPCWSLAALLAQMPCVELVSSQDNRYRAFWHERFSGWHESAVDACMELLNRENSQGMHTCRQCVHCDWHNQYCMAKDSDMGKKYMTEQKNCNKYEPKDE